MSTEYSATYQDGVDVEAHLPQKGGATNYGAANDEGELPPAYDTVTADAPPSYDSIFGEIKQAKNDSDGTVDFMKKLSIIIVGTIGCTVVLGLFLAIPIACIVIGVEYKGDENCPIQPKISIYLIVLGAFGLLRNLIGLFNQAKKKLSDSTDEETNVKKTTCESIIDCFLLAWFICGNVWVYRNYQPNYLNAAADDYCNKTLYLFAFWLNTSVYIFMGVSCCCACCIGTCAALVKGD